MRSAKQLDMTLAQVTAAEDEQLGNSGRFSVVKEPEPSGTT
jgi:hypothetical protein